VTDDPALQLHLEHRRRHDALTKLSTRRYGIEAAGAVRVQAVMPARATEHVVCPIGEFGVDGSREADLGTIATKQDLRPLPREERLLQP
jgi:hypothetical protein